MSQDPQPRHFLSLLDLSQKELHALIHRAIELKAMLRSHLPEKGELSICNHRRDGGGTESSHIIHAQGDSIAWSSLSGFPCENDYRTVSLFG